MPEIAIAVQEKPILFSGAMVRKIIEDLKTKTRRVMKPQPFLERSEKGSWWLLDRSEDGYGRTNSAWEEGKEPFWTYCPYGKPGDRLWVRESFNIGWLDGGKVLYRADGGSAKEAGYPSEPVYKPSIHMPRWASRLTLEIVSVKVERVQEISEADAIAEGVERNCPNWNDAEKIKSCPACAPSGICQAKDEFIHAGLGECDFPVTAKEAFQYLWDSINAKREGGKYAWAKNPWVWAIEFRRVEPTQ